MSDKIEINGETYLIIRSSDVIEADAKAGKKYWRGHVVRNTSGEYFTCTESWKDTKTGFSKKVWSEPYFAEPKNVGKANETTNLTQAYSEFDSMVQKEKDKRLAERPMPMLAHTYSKKKDKVLFPVFVQPKFDGMRVLYDGQTAWSRGNKDIIPEVFAHLHFDTKGYVIDGELILPDNPKVNETMMAAKKYRKGISDQLVYRVYDIVDSSLTFAERFEKLSMIVLAAQLDGQPNVILSPTAIANTHDDIAFWHGSYTEQGYEGSIIRLRDGKYEIGKRSDALLKHKDFVDGEFEIVDVIPSGGGSAAEVGKFVCVTENGDRFESTATGTEDERREYLRNKKSYIGKYAKVKYREMSGKNNVPFHSNVLEIRETKNEGY